MNYLEFTISRYEDLVKINKTSCRTALLELMFSLSCLVINILAIRLDGQNLNYLAAGAMMVNSIWCLINYVERLADYNHSKTMHNQYKAFDERKHLNDVIEQYQKAKEAFHESMDILSKAGEPVLSQEKLGDMAKAERMTKQEFVDRHTFRNMSCTKNDQIGPRY